MRREIMVCALVGITTLTAANSLAGTRRGSGNENNQQRIAQQMMQQNAALEQEKAALAAERDALKSQVEKFDAAHAEDMRALSNAKDNAAVLTGRFKDLLGKHSDLQAQDKSVQAKLEDAERRIKILNGKVADLAHQDSVCEASNRKLYELNVELLDRYRKKGVFAAMLQHEPVTGLADVEMQNTIQKYRDQMDAQSISTATGDGR